MRQERFQSILRKHGMVAPLRPEQGYDIADGCPSVTTTDKAMELMGSATAFARLLLAA